MDINQDISLIIQKISRHWQQVASDNRGVSRIDKDILLNEVRHLYDRLLELNIDQPGTAQALEAIKPPTEEPSPHIEKPLDMQPGIEDNKPREELIPEEIEKPINKEKAEEVIKVEAKAPAKKQELAKDTTLVPPKEPVIIQSKPKSPNQKPASNADKFAAQKIVADRFAKDEDRSFAAKLKNNKLGDIKSAIGINDRFLFINEIFKGDHQQYQEAMAKFNTCDNYHQALEYLEQIKTKNLIENKEAMTALLDIVKRKYR